MADSIVTPSSESPSFSWWKMVGLLYIAVPIILFLNILTHEEPPGAIAPTGLLNIPCFVCSLIPLLIVVFMRRVGEVRKYPGENFPRPESRFRFTMTQRVPYWWDTSRRDALLDNHGDTGHNDT